MTDTSLRPGRRGDRTRGSAHEFVNFEIIPGSNLLFVSAYFTRFLKARECCLNHRAGSEVLGERRIHLGNKGRFAGAGHRYLFALKGALDRRRANGT